jgi:dihydrofolate synthase/folylpolyglutamate synthase
MNYKQTLAYLFDQLPMFHRSGAIAYKANLDNTIALCKHLGNPEKKFRSVHIAGTNGKGSSSHMLASVLQAAGYKVGLFTSPHLKDFRERIKINGVEIKKSLVTGFVQRNKKAIESIQPSFFEMTVGLAFEYFANEKVDIAIVETGLGGRLDATNILEPLVSLITNISLDHTDLLGTTIEQIAFEKAGIIKPNTPIVISQTQAGSEEVFRNKASKENASIVFADAHFKSIVVETHAPNILQCTIEKNNRLYLHAVPFDLTGTYQLMNAPGVLQTLDLLNNQGYKILKGHLTKGLSMVKANTGLRGRWDVLRKVPLTICDTGHNVEGLQQVVAQLKMMAYKKLHFVLGVVKDKDISGLLEILPKDATYYFCKASIPRGLEAISLKEKAADFHLKGTAYSSVKAALEAALKAAEKADLVFVGGSTFVVAEII